MGILTVIISSVSKFVGGGLTFGLSRLTIYNLFYLVTSLSCQKCLYKKKDHLVPWRVLIIYKDKK